MANIGDRFGGLGTCWDITVLPVTFTLSPTSASITVSPRARATDIALTVDAEEAERLGVRIYEDTKATDLELDEIKQRVRRNAANPSRRSQSMKSRFAILAMLVTGMLFSTAGIGGALSLPQAANASAHGFHPTVRCCGARAWPRPRA